jgi:hypothetical protein
MNSSGDAAEQVVRLSIEGVEVVAKLSGTGLKNLAILLTTILKEEQKTKGRARLTNMLKCGKELSVFSVEKKELKAFSREANRYGVLYCVVKSKYGKNGKEMIDVIARAEDSAKINRIVENYQIGVVERSKIIREVEKESPYQEIAKQSKENEGKEKVTGKKQTPDIKDKEHQSEPNLNKEHSNVSESQNNKTSNESKSQNKEQSNDKEPQNKKSSNESNPQNKDNPNNSNSQNNKPSVRAKLKEYQSISKEKEKEIAIAAPEKKSNNSQKIVHTHPHGNKKPRGKQSRKGGR